MKKYICLLMGCLLIFSALASCEELIEADPPNNQISTAAVFADAQTAYSALSSLYSGLRSRSVISGNNYGMGALLGAYADDLDCYYNDQNAYSDLYTNQQQVTNTVIESFWKTAYQQIYAANNIIAGAANSTALSTLDKQQITGEALLIRSMLYFYLQRIFDTVPYTTSVDYEYNRKLVKVPQAELLSYLERDLIQAAGMLGDTYRDSERIYPNGKVAQLLLSQVYLLQGRYPDAQQAASLVLESPLYQFEGNIDAVFHNTGTHILWQVKPPYGGDATQEASFYTFADAPPHAYALTQGLVESFAAEDQRRSLWITLVESGGDQWYRPAKYKNLSGANTNEYSIAYRLEEVYMIMAEALAMQDNFAEAAPYLNATRLRAGLLEVHPVSREGFLNEIMLEKRREFFAEQGMRFLDLKRWGKLGQLSLVKQHWAGYKAQWPIPQNELLLNPNLNPQNDGY